ncbi:MAG: phospholipase [Alphaproteobacteria bacterium]|nr:phospholipase [Alphaproteobacteria bacterium]
MAQPLDGPSFGPATGGRPDSLVVLLHGLGADGNDLIGLAPAFAQALPGTLFVSPDAPQPCDMAPYGRQWFSLQDRRPATIEAGVRAAASILDAFLDGLLAGHGLGGDRLALVGFSQGTMMSLHVGLRRTAGPAAIVGYSGSLVTGNKLPAEIVSRPPVLLVHGDADPILPPSALDFAEAALKAAGVPVDAHLRPGLPHSIDEEGVRLGTALLVRTLGRRA